MGHLAWGGQDVAGSYTPAVVPDHVKVISMFLSCVTLTTIATCLARRWSSVKNWRSVSLCTWLLFGVYIDSFIFVFTAAVMKDVGINTSKGMCHGAVIICLVFYMTAKVLVYYFLVEKAHIVRATNLSRRSDKVYILTCFGMMIPFGIIFILVVIWRIGYINKEGMCIIGIGAPGLIPLVIFDGIINIYLTVLFIVPLRRLHSYKSGARNGYLHQVALRTFIGSCLTLFASITNIIFLLVLDGEASWLCFISCNSDVLFSVLVLHWVTSTDRPDDTPTHGRYPDSETKSSRTHHRRSRSDELEDDERELNTPSGGRPESSDAKCSASVHDSNKIQVTVTSEQLSGSSDGSSSDMGVWRKAERAAEP